MINQDPIDVKQDPNQPAGDADFVKAGDAAQLLADSHAVFLDVNRSDEERAAAGEAVAAGLAEIGDWEFAADERAITFRNLQASMQFAESELGRREMQRQLQSGEPVIVPAGGYDSQRQFQENWFMGTKDPLIAAPDGTKMPVEPSRTFYEFNLVDGAVQGTTIVLSDAGAQALQSHPENAWSIIQADAQGAGALSKSWGYHQRAASNHRVVTPDQWDAPWHVGSGDATSWQGLNYGGAGVPFAKEMTPKGMVDMPVRPGAEAGADLGMAQIPGGWGGGDNFAPARGSDPHAGFKIPVIDTPQHDHVQWQHDLGFEPYNDGDELVVPRMHTFNPDGTVTSDVSGFELPAELRDKAAGDVTLDARYRRAVWQTPPDEDGAIRFQLPDGRDGTKDYEVPYYPAFQADDTYNLTYVDPDTDQLEVVTFTPSQTDMVSIQTAMKGGPAGSIFNHFFYSPPGADLLGNIAHIAGRAGELFGVESDWAEQHYVTSHNGMKLPILNLSGDLETDRLLMQQPHIQRMAMDSRDTLTQFALGVTGAMGTALEFTGPTKGLGMVSRRVGGMMTKSQWLMKRAPIYQQGARSAKALIESSQAGAGAGAAAMFRTGLRTGFDWGMYEGTIGYLHDEGFAQGFIGGYANFAPFAVAGKMITVARRTKHAAWSKMTKGKSPLAKLSPESPAFSDYRSFMSGLGHNQEAMNRFMKQAQALVGGGASKEQALGMMFKGPGAKANVESAVDAGVLGIGFGAMGVAEANYERDRQANDPYWNELSIVEKAERTFAELNSAEALGAGVGFAIHPLVNAAKAHNDGAAALKQLNPAAYQFMVEARPLSQGLAKLYAADAETQMALTALMEIARDGLPKETQGLHETIAKSDPKQERARQKKILPSQNPSEIGGPTAKERVLENKLDFLLELSPTEMKRVLQELHMQGETALLNELRNSATVAPETPADFKNGLETARMVRDVIDGLLAMPPVKEAVASEALLLREQKFEKAKLRAQDAKEELELLKIEAERPEYEGMFTSATLSRIQSEHGLVAENGMVFKAEGQTGVVHMMNKVNRRGIGALEIDGQFQIVRLRGEIKVPKDATEKLPRFDTLKEAQDFIVKKNIVDFGKRAKFDRKLSDKPFTESELKAAAEAIKEATSNGGQKRATSALRIDESGEIVYDSRQQRFDGVEMWGKTAEAFALNLAQAQADAAAAAAKPKPTPSKKPTPKPSAPKGKSGYKVDPLVAIKRRLREDMLRFDNTPEKKLVQAMARRIRQALKVQSIDPKSVVELTHLVETIPELNISLLARGMSSMLQAGKITQAEFDVMIERLGEASHLLDLGASSAPKEEPVPPRSPRYIGPRMGEGWKMLGGKIVPKSPVVQLPKDFKEVAESASERTNKKRATDEEILVVMEASRDHVGKIPKYRDEYAQNPDGALLKYWEGYLGTEKTLGQVKRRLQNAIVSSKNAEARAANTTVEPAAGTVKSTDTISQATGGEPVRDRAADTLKNPKSNIGDVEYQALPPEQQSLYNKAGQVRGVQRWRKKQPPKPKPEQVEVAPKTPESDNRSALDVQSGKPKPVNIDAAVRLATQTNVEIPRAGYLTVDATGQMSGLRAGFHLLAGGQQKAAKLDIDPVTGISAGGKEVKLSPAKIAELKKAGKDFVTSEVADKAVDIVVDLAGKPIEQRQATAAGLLLQFGPSPRTGRLNLVKLLTGLNTTQVDAVRAELHKLGDTHARELAENITPSLRELEAQGRFKPGATEMLKPDGTVTPFGRAVGLIHAFPELSVTGYQAKSLLTGSAAKQTSAALLAEGQRRIDLIPEVERQSYKATIERLASSDHLGGKQEWTDAGSYIFSKLNKALPAAEKAEAMKFVERVLDGEVVASTRSAGGEKTATGEMDFDALSSGERPNVAEEMQTTAATKLRLETAVKDKSATQEQRQQAAESLGSIEKEEMGEILHGVKQASQRLEDTVNLLLDVHVKDPVSGELVAVLDMHKKFRSARDVVHKVPELLVDLVKGGEMTRNLFKNGVTSEGETVFKDGQWETAYNQTRETVRDWMSSVQEFHSRLFVEQAKATLGTKDPIEAVEQADAFKAANRAVFEDVLPAIQTGSAVKNVEQVRELLQPLQEMMRMATVLGKEGGRIDVRQFEILDQHGVVNPAFRDAFYQYGLKLYEMAQRRESMQLEPAEARLLRDAQEEMMYSGLDFGSLWNWMSGNTHTAVSPFSIAGVVSKLTGNKVRPGNITGDLGAAMARNSEYWSATPTRRKIASTFWKGLARWSTTLGRPTQSGALPDIGKIRTGAADAKTLWETALGNNDKLAFKMQTILDTFQKANLSDSTLEAMGKFIHSGGMLRARTPQEFAASFGKGTEPLFPLMLKVVESFNEVGAGLVATGAISTKQYTSLQNQYVPQQWRQVAEALGAMTDKAVTSGREKRRNTESNALKSNIEDQIWNVGHLMSDGLRAENARYTYLGYLTRLRNSDAFLSKEQYESLSFMEKEMYANVADSVVTPKDARAPFLNPAGRTGPAWDAHVKQSLTRAEAAEVERMVAQGQVAEAEAYQQNLAVRRLGGDVSSQRLGLMLRSELETGDLTAAKSKLIEDLNTGYILKGARPWVAESMNGMDAVVQGADATVTRSIDSAFAMWRRMRTVHSPKHWFNNLVSSVPTNDAMGAASYGEFIIGITRGTGPYAESARALEAYGKWNAEGRPDITGKEGEAHIRMVDALMTETGNTSATRLLSNEAGTALFTGMMDVTNGTPMNGGSMAEAAAIGTQRVAPSMRDFETRFNFAMGVQNPLGLKEALRAQLGVYAQNEMFFKLAGYMSLTAKGVPHKEAVKRAWNGTANYGEINPTLKGGVAAGSAPLRASETAAIRQLGGKPGLVETGRLAKQMVSAPFMSFNLAFLPAMAGRVLTNTVSVAASYGSYLAAMYALTGSDEGDHQDLQEINIGQPGYLYTQMPEKDRQDFLKKYGAAQIHPDNPALPREQMPTVGEYLEITRMLLERLSTGDVPFGTAGNQTLTYSASRHMPGGQIAARAALGQFSGAADSLSQQFHMGMPLVRAIAVLQYGLNAGKTEKGKSKAMSYAESALALAAEMSSPMSGVPELSQTAQLMQRVMQGRTLPEILRGAAPDTSRSAADRLSLAGGRAMLPIGVAPQGRPEQPADTFLGQAKQQAGAMLEQSDSQPPFAMDDVSLYKNLDAGIKRGFSDVIEKSLIQAFDNLQTSYDTAMLAGGDSVGYNAHVAALANLLVDVAPNGRLVEKPQTMPGKFIKQVSESPDQEIMLIEAFNERLGGVDDKVYASIEYIASNSFSLNMPREVFTRAVRGLVRETGKSEKTFDLIYKNVVEDKDVESYDVWHAMHRIGRHDRKTDIRAQRINQALADAGYQDYEEPSYQRLQEVLGPDPFSASAQLAVDAYNQFLGTPAQNY